MNVGQFERVLSAVGGARLVWAGLRRGTFPGLALAGLGGLLIGRGVSGVCPAYRLFGINHAGSAPEREQPETAAVEPGFGLSTQPLEVPMTDLTATAPRPPTSGPDVEPGYDEVYEGGRAIFERSVAEADRGGSTLGVRPEPEA